MGVICLSESTELRRKAAGLRRIAVSVFTGQKPLCERIVRNHRETLFLRQRQEFFRSSCETVRYSGPLQYQLSLGQLPGVCG